MTDNTPTITPGDRYELRDPLERVTVKGVAGDVIRYHTQGYHVGSIQRTARFAARIVRRLDGGKDTE